MIIYLIRKNEKYKYFFLKQTAKREHIGMSTCSNWFLHMYMLKLVRICCSRIKKNRHGREFYFKKIKYFFYIIIFMIFELNLKDRQLYQKEQERSQQQANYSDSLHRC